jgi:hypothetical protein
MKLKFSTDVIVHRLLQACVDQDLTYGQELTDKMKMKELCDSMFFIFQQNLSQSFSQMLITSIT